MLSGVSPPARNKRRMGAYLGNSWMGVAGGCVRPEGSRAPVRARAWMSLLRENKTALWFLNHPWGFPRLVLGGLLVPSAPHRPLWPALPETSVQPSTSWYSDVRSWCWRYLLLSLEQRGNAVTTVPTAKSLLESELCVRFYTRLCLLVFGLGMGWFFGFFFRFR